MSKQVNLAVLGTKGAVGQEIIRILEERQFPVSKIKFLGSSNSAGREQNFRGETFIIEEANPSSFNGIDIVLSSPGGSVSKELLPHAVEVGACAIDNTSAFRMNPDTALVVPEVNPGDIPADILETGGIIANPNCSTIQMVTALWPLHEQFKIKRIVVSTYQSVSGAGRTAMEQLKAEASNNNFIESCYEGRRMESGISPAGMDKFPHAIAYNILPQIDDFLASGYTKEEMKMINETRKIMHEPGMRITATTVRVPVYRGHAESINIETEVKVSRNEARALLEKAPGIIVCDDPDKKVYPLPIMAQGQDATYVGRIREDESIENGLNLWVVSDNLRKGAALNAVEIAELLINR